MSLKKVRTFAEKYRRAVIDMNMISLHCADREIKLAKIRFSDQNNFHYKFSLKNNNFFDWTKLAMECSYTELLDIESFNSTMLEILIR